MGTHRKTTAILFSWFSRSIPFIFSTSSKLESIGFYIPSLE